MHKKNISYAGKKLSADSKVLIMIHGRGAGAEDIMGLTGYLDVSEFSVLAPTATNNTWYPYSFLAPPSQNEPWLSSGINLIKTIVDDLIALGIKTEQIYFLGFSQGACLTLEFTSRHAKHYGGIVAFTGGLIGDRIYKQNYSGNFQGTPVFIGTSDPDTHVPVERVKASAEILTELGAATEIRIYKNMGHTISGEEIRLANEFVFQKKPVQ